MKKTFIVKIIASKYAVRLGRYYKGYLSDSDTPFYLLSNNKTKVRFKPVYEFRDTIITATKNGEEEVGEVIYGEWENINNIMKQKHVKIHNGKKIPLKDCVQIGDYYYIKDIEAIEINGKWVKRRPYHIKCEKTGKWINITSAILSPIDVKDGAIILGAIEKGKSVLYPLYKNDLKIQKSALLNDKIKNASKESVLGIDIFDNPITDSNLIINIEKFIQQAKEATNGVPLSYSATGLAAQIRRSSSSNNIPRENILYVPDRDILSKLNAVESLSHGIFVLNPKDLKNIPIPEYRKFNQKKAKEENPEKAIELGVESKTFILTGGNKYTFGVEVETTSGLIPEYAADNLNVECMRDGSIVSGEYVTGVLKGDAGVVQLNKLLYEINKRCTFDQTCGLHIHIGSANFTKAFTVAAYCLGQIIYPELTTVVSKSRANNRYCTQIPKMLPKLTAEILAHTEFSKLQKYDLLENNSLIHNLYLHIFEFLCDGEKMNPSPSEDIYPLSQIHTMRRGWGRAPRYTWLNLLPCNFIRLDRENISNEKIYGKNLKHTIEFRLHHGTFDFDKIYMWLLLCMSYVKYCEVNADKVIKAYLTKEKITIEDIITFGVESPKLRKSALEYYAERKQFFRVATKENEEYELTKSSDFSNQNYKEYL